jgi:hypothetical protein
MKTMRVVCILLMIGFVASAVFAKETNRTAKIISCSGNISVKTAGQSDWQPAVKGMVLNQGDMIKTGANSNARLNVDGMGEAATVDLFPNSNLTMAELVQDKDEGTERTLLDLAMGEVMVKAQKLYGDKSKFEVKTPTSVAGVRGTKFSVKVEALE